MSPNSYLGTISEFAGTFAPKGWLRCDGQRLLVEQFELLFSLLGTTYGGDGKVIFYLPNLNQNSKDEDGRPIGTIKCICVDGPYPEPF